MVSSACDLYINHVLCHMTCAQGLNVVDLEDLMEDIKVYLELESESHRDYWKVKKECVVNERTTPSITMPILI